MYLIALVLHFWVFILWCVGRYNADTDCLELSYSRFKKSNLPALGHMVLAVFRALRLIRMREGVGEDGEYVECSNMTIINLALHIVGPTHERRLTIYLLTFQASCLHYLLAHDSIPSVICLVSKAGHLNGVHVYVYCIDR